jgi:hypothetical protein
MVAASDILLAAVAFGPMILLLYYTLRDYTHPKVEKPFFDDRKVFAFMTLGIVLGTVFFFIDMAAGSYSDLSMIILIGAVIPILQGLIKLAILNWRKFQRKVDTAFYGLSLGLGMSATYAFSKMFMALMDQTADLSSIALVVMMGVQIILIQGSTTAMIGVGCARGHPWIFFAYSMIFALAYSYLLYGLAVVAENGVGVASVVLMMWALCAYAYWHVYRIDLPNLIDDAKRGLRYPTKK